MLLAHVASALLERSQLLRALLTTSIILNPGPLKAHSRASLYDLMSVTSAPETTAPWRQGLLSSVCL